MFACNLFSSGFFSQWPSAIFFRAVFLLVFSSEIFSPDIYLHELFLCICFLQRCLLRTFACKCFLRKLALHTILCEYFLCRCFLPRFFSPYFAFPHSFSRIFSRQQVSCTCLFFSTRLFQTICASSRFPAHVFLLFFSEILCTCSLWRVFSGIFAALQFFSSFSGDTTPPQRLHNNPLPPQSNNNPPPPFNNYTPPPFNNYTPPRPSCCVGGGGGRPGSQSCKCPLVNYSLSLHNNNPPPPPVTTITPPTPTLSNRSLWNDTLNCGWIKRLSSWPMGPP